MLDLLDCLIPACHEASAVTTPFVADVTVVHSFDARPAPAG